VGQSWPTRAPVRRALIPAKRSNNNDRRDAAVTNVGSRKSLSDDVDDRVHNALLEELCADFGVTDSSYVDFLSFDIPADRVQSGQLPADLEELGEIVSFGTMKPKTVVSQGIRSNSTSSSRVGLLGPGVTTAKATSGMQMTIPDDVASPTISSSCEDGKPAIGGGEGLSDFPPIVHSTTGCISVKTDSDTAGCNEDSLKHSSDNSESLAETEYERVMPPLTRLPDEQGSSAVSPLKDRPVRNDSNTSSPKHVAKKARVIASGGDLLEDVKKSYAFVCGADMFTAPTQPAMSHPRVHLSVGLHNEPGRYSRHTAGYGTRTTFTDVYENPFQYGVHNPTVGQPPVPDDKSYGTSSAYSANFDNSTPVKGYPQHFGNEWQSGSASCSDSSCRTNVMHHINMLGRGAVDFRPDGGQFMRDHSSGMFTSSDMHGAVLSAGGVQYPRRIAEFPGTIDQRNLNYQPVNHGPHSVDESVRSYGYSTGSYGGSYHHVGRPSGPQQSDICRSPLSSPYRGQTLHGSLTTNETGNVCPSGHLYPPRRTNSANVNAAYYTEQVQHSLPASPVRYGGRSGTPGFVSSYPVQSRIENNPPTGRMSLTMESNLQQASTIPAVQTDRNIRGVQSQNEFTYRQMNTGSGLYAEQRGTFPRVTPAGPDLSVMNPMTPHGVLAPPDAEQSYGTTTNMPLRPTADSSCHSFVRHLIGSGSGPYRSHPLFPLLRDLVIADMNFEAPSFPYPLIAGLPRSFDRLISNYFSCTAQVNPSSVDPSVDAVVVDALRYAHSALLGNCVHFVVVIITLCSSR